MVDKRNAHFEGNGLDKIESLLRERGQRNVILKQLLEHWGGYGEGATRRHAPSKTGYLQAHIGASGIIYEPGAPGGGGGYEKIVGVRGGESKHPIYVHFGTANPEDQDYTAFASAGITPEAQGRIYPTQSRALKQPQLPEVGGRTQMRVHVSGQSAQPYVYLGYLETAVYARSQLRAAAKAAGL